LQPLFITSKIGWFQRGCINQSLLYMPTLSGKSGFETCLAGPLAFRKFIVMHLLQQVSSWLMGKRSWSTHFFSNAIHDQRYYWHHL